MARNPILVCNGGPGTGKSTAGFLALSVRGTDAEMMNGATLATLRMSMQLTNGGLLTINDWHLAISKLQSCTYADVNLHRGPHNQ